MPDGARGASREAESGARSDAAGAAGGGRSTRRRTLQALLQRLRVSKVTVRGDLAGTPAEGNLHTRHTRIMSIISYLEGVVGEGDVGRVHKVFDEEVEGVGQVPRHERGQILGQQQREDLLGQRWKVRGLDRQRFPM